MTESNWQSHISEIVILAEEVGQFLKKMQNNDLTISTKQDGSLVSDVDIKAQEIIENKLLSLVPDIPVIGEENDNNHEYATEIIAQGLAWLVDPLDGTKGYLNGKDEYTVNIGLVYNGRPLWGVIAAPAFNEVYAGGSGLGAFAIVNSIKNSITTSIQPAVHRGLIPANIANIENIQVLLPKTPVIRSDWVSSSLKFCYLASAKFEYYGRLAPLKEWDTAAGHAIINGAGGEVFSTENGLPLKYGKNALTHKGFLACYKA